MAYKIRREKGNPIIKKVVQTNPLGEKFLFGIRKDGSVVTLKYLGKK